MNLSIDEVLDAVLKNYRQAHPIDDAQLASSRERVGSYIAKLTSAGRRDPQDIAAYAWAYLKELREGPDPHCTGC
jgi:hypothetical protein